MLAEIQVKRLLSHCKEIDKEYKKLDMAGDEGVPYFNYQRNKGWVHALQLVLKDDTEPISKKPLKEGL